jgi:hypothetical protein
MKDIPLNAKVECADGPCGETTTLIIDPTTRKVTHVVVKDPGSVERLVPFDQVANTGDDLIHLGCTKAGLAEMRPFIETHYVKSEASYQAGASYQGAALAYQAPYAVHKRDRVPVEEERIPSGQLAVHRGARVQATDGHAGKVGEFVNDPDSGEISHLILMKGHLWGKKEIAVPVSAINFSDEDTVYLKLDKHAIDQLPVVPVTRHQNGG